MTFPSASSVELVINGLPLQNPHVGLGVYAWRLIHGLLRHAPDLSFKVLLPAGVSQKLTGIPPQYVDELPSFPSLGHHMLDGIAGQIRIAYYARRKYPQAIFHTTELFWSPFRPARVAVTLHDTMPRRFPRYLGRYPFRKILMHAAERFARQSDLIMAISECTARDLIELASIPAEKIHILYNWIDPTGERDSALKRAGEVRARYNLPDIFWVYLGGYDYRKNIERLLEAYAQANSTVAVPPLVLAGKIPTDLSKPYCDVQGALKATGLTPASVLCPGLIATKDLPTVLAMASLLVYPSLYEGFGYPPAEAMAVGTPVLVSNTSSLPEVVRRSECRFDPLDVPALAEKLREAAADSSRFHCDLPEEFTERFAMTRYCSLIETLHQQPSQ